MAWHALARICAAAYVDEKPESEKAELAFIIIVVRKRLAHGGFHLM